MLQRALGVPTGRVQSRRRPCPFRPGVGSLGMSVSIAAAAVLFSPVAIALPAHTQDAATVQHPALHGWQRVQTPPGWTVSPRGQGAEPEPSAPPPYPPPSSARPAPTGWPPASPSGGLGEPSSVQRDELAPVMAGDGSGLPLELWGGLQLAEVEQLISKLTLPPLSPTLHGLWKRLMTAGSNRTGGAGFAAVSLEALYRSGLSAAAADRSASEQGGSPVLTILVARDALAENKADAACAAIRNVGNLQGEIPARLKGEAILLTGYCAAESGKAEAAGLAAELAREQGVTQSVGLDALDAIGSGSKSRLKANGPLTVIDYRLATKAGGVAAADVLKYGEPALLAAIANDSNSSADVGLPASEAAARINTIEPAMLAAIYRANGKPGGGLSDDASASPEARATVFRAAEEARDPNQRARLITAFVDGMRREGMGSLASQMVGPLVEDMRPEPRLAWFAETAAEASIASTDYDGARRWAGLSPNTSHWAALADIADSRDGTRGAHLIDLERRALSGQFAAETLHRLVTVLDALSYQVPIPLWDAASRTPQPTDGFLPETGVLSRLQDAAKKREFGRTVLLVMQTIGPDGPDGANLLTLGDSIRALKRAGLEAEARRIGVEALISRWSRASGGPSGGIGNGQ